MNHQKYAPRDVGSTRDPYDAITAVNPSYARAQRPSIAQDPHPNGCFPRSTPRYARLPRAPITANGNHEVLHPAAASFRPRRRMRSAIAR